MNAKLPPDDPLDVPPDVPLEALPVPLVVDKDPCRGCISGGLNRVVAKRGVSEGIVTVGLKLPEGSAVVVPTVAGRLWRKMVTVSPG